MVLVLSMLSFVYAGTKSAYAGDTRQRISGVRVSALEDLRSLDVSDLSDDLSVSSFDAGSSEKYTLSSAEWNTDIGSLSAGDQPEVLLTFEAGTKDKSNGDVIEYYFSGNYGPSNVSVSGADFVRASRSGNYTLEVVIKLRALKGEYGEPSNLEWNGQNLGTATFTAPGNTSGYYDVVLKRDSSRIVTITTNLTSVNLYPWMAKEGNYTFSVRTVPYGDGSKGKKSEEAESGGLEITEANKSDGSGKYDTTLISQSPAQNGSNGTTPQAGWYQIGSAWYFRYPNNVPATNTWLLWKDHWFRFDAGGKMLTGWFQNAYGKWFYLKPEDGAMRTDWYQIDGTWYYFNPQKGDHEGDMYYGTLAEIRGKSYYFADNGKMQTGWTKIGNDYYYFSQDGSMVKSAEVDGFRLGADGKWVH